MSRYPNRKEAALISLRRQSGMMGLFVSMQRILSLSACPSGLRVGMNRIFGPFAQPFFVPWDEISASRTSFLFLPMVKLKFEKSEFGVVWLYPKTWKRLEESAPLMALATDRLAPMTDLALLKGLAAYWVTATALAGSFFYFASQHLIQSGPALPLELCFGFPALVFGVSAAVLFVTQRG